MYPVAYKAGALAYRAGIQSVARAPSASAVIEALGPFVRGLPVVAAFLFGFEATWSFLDWLDAQDEPGPLPEGFGTVATIVQPVAAVPEENHYIPATGWTKAAGGGACLAPYQSWHDGIHFAGWRYQTTCNTSGIGACATAGGPPNSISGARMAFMLYALEPPFSGYVIQEKWYATGCPATAPADYPRVVPGSPEVPAVRIPMDVDYPLDSPTFDRASAGVNVLPDRIWDGVRAPPVGWPWAWPRPLRGAPPAHGVPERVVGDGDSVLVGGISLPWADDIPIERAPPGTREVVTIGVGVGPAPLTVTRARTDSIREIRPAKDRKFNNPKILIGLKILANAVTESRDLVSALWKALPDQCKRKYRGPHGGHRKARPNEMIEDIKFCFHNSSFVYSKKLGKGRSYEGEQGLSAYVHKALIEVLANEMQDGLYGLAGQKYKAAVKNLHELGYYNRPVGLQSGDRFRPYVRAKGAPDVFNDAATAVINALW